MKLRCVRLSVCLSVDLALFGDSLLHPHSCRVQQATSRMLASHGSLVSHTHTCTHSRVCGEQHARCIDTREHSKRRHTCLDAWKGSASASRSKTNKCPLQPSRGSTIAIFPFQIVCTCLDVCDFLSGDRSSRRRPTLRRWSSSAKPTC